MTTTEADIARAAKTLSMRQGDIVEADESPAGFVITTRDGVRYIDVPADQPDADGKSGLMFLAKPNPERTYSFPVYTPPEDDEDDEDEGTPSPDAGESESKGTGVVGQAPPRAGRGSGVKNWRKFADANDVDLDGATSRDDVIARCEQAGLIDPEDTNE